MRTTQSSGRRTVRHLQATTGRSPSDRPLISDATAVRSSALRNFLQFVSSMGADGIQLLQRSGIDPAALEISYGRISYRSLVNALANGAAELNCPDFGMRLAETQGGAKVLGPLDIVMRNASTVGNAFRYCAEHVRAYSSATELSVEDFPGEQLVALKFEIVLNDLPDARQAIEHALLLTQHAALDFSGGRACPTEVWLAHGPVSNPPVYRRHFLAPVRFGQRINAIWFRAGDFARTIPESDPQLYEIATSYISHHYPITAAFSARVRAVIQRLLAEGRCTHERAAEALYFHPRTLQRRLRAEGMTFEMIRDSVRRDAALCYLRQRQLPLPRVAANLGYSGVSVLSHSCRRWFSASPGQLRNELEHGTQ